MHAALRSLLLGMALAPALAGVAMADEPAGKDKPVLGWIEKVSLEPWDVELKAKLDSGALTSSLDARDIEVFDKDGEKWVRFRLRLEDQGNDETFSKTLERPMYRDLTVRGAGGRDERPVVTFEVCVGDTRYEEQFSLRDREEMLYPMLLGRRSIGHFGLLDVRRTFTSEPNCDADSPLVALVDGDESEGES